MMIKMRNVLLLPIGLLILAGCQENENSEIQDSEEQVEETQQSSQQQLPQQFQQNPKAENISDEELEKFVDLDMKLRGIQQKAQQEMIALVEEGGMEVQKYQEIAQSKQTGSEDEFSADELQIFDDINEDLAVIEQSMNQDIETKIQDEGVSLERFQEVAMSIRQSPELQKKLQGIINEKTGGQQLPPAQ